MPNTEELKKMRFQFLNLLYKKTGGNKFSHVNKRDLGSELGYERDVTESISQYLEAENLLEYVTVCGGIAITHDGVKEVQEATSNPEEPTLYFPPINVINIHHMEGSQIQQGTSSSNQTGTFKLTNGVEINEFIKLLKKQLPELTLTSDDESEIKSDITTLESQVVSSRPKSEIIKESLSSIKRILEGATGSVVAQQLLPYIPTLMAAIN